MQDHMFFDNQAKTVIAWLGSSDSLAIFTRYCTFGFSFFLSLYKILLKEKISIPRKIVHLEQFFAQKFKKFWEMELWSCLKKWQKVVEQSGEWIK